ncbi:MULTISPECIES: DUF4402 domain-containing protein [unclassified Novosphingobium]|uniref:DUF4402 domain-containing protein n=1 Tax=unclassified Novosphingobium TaxID=2644732 RepID=UPI00146F7231|nr:MULTISPECIES: DUF4402 domain-containing protein [unclassified Novosphingobium]NMN06515.1 hypothetical protein [Novosphingobium sp. SG919]NMN89037.1 hypothetical protein [Novosphingobium sp. SG916]
MIGNRKPGRRTWSGWAAAGLVWSSGIVLGLAPGSAQAAPNKVTVSGTAAGTVVAPISVRQINGMSFGQFVQPASAGALVLSTDGTLTASGGMGAQTTIAQSSANPPRAGQFAVDGDAGRLFYVTLPSSTTLTGNGASMTVSNFTQSTFFGFAWTDSDGEFTLNVGAQLNVNARQAVGTYRGTYAVTVTYL